MNTTYIFEYTIKITINQEVYLVYLVYLLIGNMHLQLGVDFDRQGTLARKDFIIDVETKIKHRKKRKR